MLYLPNLIPHMPHEEKHFLDRKMADLFGLVFDRPKVILAVMTSCLTASGVAYGKSFF